VWCDPCGGGGGGGGGGRETMKAARMQRSACKK